MLAIVTCHYNFAGYDRPRQNLWRFLRQMKRDGVPVYGVEIHAEGHMPITTGVENWVQIEANCNQIMWQKERALNIAEKMVPSKYDNLAWVDADVWFDRPDWANATEKALENYAIVQMFEHAYLTDKDGSIFMNRPSAGFKKECTSKWDTHPGLAWAMRRELWERGAGLFQYSITGGADSLMSVLFVKGEMWDYVWSLVGSNRGPFLEWAKSYSSISLGAVSMSCFHEWHGEFKNRGYCIRTQALSTLDSEKHIKIGHNGLLEFTSYSHPGLIFEMQNYYYRRKEDG